jgi:hypothetical protein
VLLGIVQLRRPPQIEQSVRAHLLIEQIEGFFEIREFWKRVAAITIE